MARAAAAAVIASWLVTAPSSAIFVGVPAPEADLVKTNDTNLVTFLTLGIVCPRKNQHWAVRQFKKFAGDRQDVRLIVVGARYTRQYEIDYVNKVKEEIDDCVTFAEKSPYPDESAVYEDIYVQKDYPFLTD